MSKEILVNRLSSSPVIVQELFGKFFLIKLRDDRHVWLSRGLDGLLGFGIKISFSRWYTLCRITEVFQGVRGCGWVNLNELDLR